MRKTTWFAAGLLALGLTWAAQARAQTAHAELKNAQGEKVGEAMLMPTPHGVLIKVDIAKLPPGEHAFHIHAVGKCEPPFKSAGGHFNPMNKEHGIENPKGMHAGDLPNIYVPEDGKLKFDAFATGVTLKAGAKNSLFHPDGTSLVIHAGADDYKSDPAGNAGDRIACGVITK
jgi:superoxide dismutase, Cu-Zn family